jgi:methyl-accepting chemotaxis protein
MNMNLRAKIYVPVVLSLVVLGGSMFLLNRQILKETFDTEMTKVLNDKEKNFNEIIDIKLDYLSQYSNALANSYAFRSALVIYDITKDIDSTWNLLNAEVDRIKFGGSQAKIDVPPINCHVPPGIVLFRSRSNKYGDNVIHNRKAIQQAFDTKKSVKGLEIGKYGIDLRGISPAFIKGKFYGTVEVNMAINDIIKEINPSEYESYAIIVDKNYINTMTKVEAINDAENFINENLILLKTDGFNKSVYKSITSKKIEVNKQLTLLDDYNYLELPIKNFDNEVIATLVYQMNNDDFKNNLEASTFSLFLIGFLIFGVSLFILLIILRIVIISPVKKVTRALKMLSKGVINDEIKVKTKDEIAEIQKALNVVNSGMLKMSNFAIEIGNENYEEEFTALSDDDVLGNTLLQVRDKLKDVSEQQQMQAKLESERKWTIEGQAKFAALLQDNEMDVKEYTYKILSNLISYLNVNQGAFFLLSKDKETLQLSSAYAYDRRKFVNKDVKLGDGLLGNSAKEMKLTYITDLPQDYINITSGLGDANPNSLIIVPLVSDDELYGVFELASFRKLEQFEVEFCSTVAESIAQAISRQQIQQQTKELLEQSRQQAEELSAQEEEMRQNLEEMQATQEEMARKEAEMTGVLNALSESSLVVEFDLKGNVLSVNDGIIELFKLSDKSQVIGKNHSDFYEVEDYQKEQNKLWEPLSRKETVSRKAQVSLPNGEKIWLNETYSPILDENGNIDRVLNISFDVTEEVTKEMQISQQNEEMLAQEEEMRQNLEEMQATQEEMARKEAEMKSILSALDLSSLVVEIDLNKSVLKVNNKILDIFGMDSLSMIQGASVIDFYENQTIEMFDSEIWNPVVNDRKTISRRSQITAPNGVNLWLNETYTPIFDENDKISKVLNISFDITEQVLKEQQISQQNEEMQVQEEMMNQNMEEMLAVQEEMARKEAEIASVIKALNSSVFLVEMDLEWEITHVNKAVLELMGIESEETILGTNHKAFYATRGYKSEKEKITAAIEQKEIYTRKADIQLPNGNKIMFNETYSPILDENEEIIRIMNISYQV